MSIHRLFPVAMVAALALSACTSSPDTESVAEQSPSSDSQGVSPSSNVTRIHVPGYPDSGGSPEEAARGRANNEHPVALHAQRSPRRVWHQRAIWSKTMPEIARALASKLEDHTVVIVLQSPRDATMLVSNASDSLVSSWSMNRFGRKWTLGYINYCDGKREVGVIT